MSDAPEVWTVQRVLDWTRDHFAKKGIDSARLDAELLLAHVLQKPRLYIYTHFDQPLSAGEREAVRTLVLRRAKREPVALILGEREFYGRPFRISRDVLSPRPETEHLIDSVREWAGERAGLRLLDLGVGSGAIAVTLAKELAGAQVTATELSAAALAVARDNAARLEATVRLLEGDLYAPVGADLFDVIAANPPYIPAGERAELMPEVRDYEPELALFGGGDGLDVVRRVIAGAWAHLGSPGLLAMEIGAGQWPAVRGLLNSDWANVRVVKDLGGHERVVLAEKP